MNLEELRLHEIDTVLFDLDGTLIDSLPTIYSLFKRVFLETSKKIVTDEYIKSLLGPPEELILSSCISETAGEKFINYYINYLTNITDTYDEIRMILHEFKYNQYNCGLVTNKGTRLATKTLNSMKICEYFDMVVTGDCGYKIKPSSEGLIHTIHTFGTSPQRTIMIGDTSSDGEAAREAGVWFIHAQWFTLGSYTFCEDSHFDAFHLDDLYRLLKPCTF